MSEASPAPNRQRRSWLRGISAVLGFIATSYASLFIFSFLGGAVTFDLVDSLWPAVSGKTPNTTTDAFLTYAQIFALPILSLLCGAIVATLVWEPDVSPGREKLLLLLSLLVLVAVSGVNFWVHDNLININAQAAIDVATALVSVAVLTILWRWSPTRPTAIGTRTVAVFLVTLLGFVLPTYFGVSYLLMKLGVLATGFSSLSSWIDEIGTVIALAASLIALKKSPRQE